MKKILILMTAFLFVLKVSNAQTQKGSQTLGLSLGYSYDKNNDFMINPNDNSSSTLINTIHSFNIGPVYSYFIADKLDVGINLGYSEYNETYRTNDFVNNSYYPTKQSGKNYGATVYVRKYVMFQNKIGFRVGPYLGYDRANTNSTYLGSNAIYNNDNRSSNDYAAGINLGLVYYPSKKLGVSATIGDLSYQHFTNNNTDKGHGSEDALNFGFINNGLTLSVYYVFGS